MEYSIPQKLANNQIYGFSFGQWSYISESPVPGAPVLIAFHGYGQSAEEIFPFLRQTFPKYHIIALDLFFHGQSTLASNKQPLSLADFKNLMSLFLTHENVQSFSLYGYSMGARFALATAALFPERILQLTLAAPDGIVPSVWYRLATGKGLFKSFFKAMSVKPGLFIRLAQAAHRLGLVQKGVAKFSLSQMQNRRQRMRVYYSWTVFSTLKTKRQKLIQLLNAHHIPVQVFLGLHDKVIPGKEIARFFTKVERASVHLLPAGHGSLQKAILKFLASEQQQI